MGFIFAIITAVVIATSAGGANTFSDGTQVNPPIEIGTADQGDNTQCLAPCTYDAATDTYNCPC
ncbi:MAG: hypothetical protein QOF61_2911 [Acidobacteriota bacterium]|jgi:hypothetical protein|nr:hypothetical protein [Acidobacteriota bacterium]